MDIPKIFANMSINMAMKVRYAPAEISLFAVLGKAVNFETSGLYKMANIPPMNKDENDIIGRKKLPLGRECDVGIDSNKRRKIDSIIRSIPANTCLEGNSSSKLSIIAEE